MIHPVVHRPCADCPFLRSGLRGLRPGRITGIVRADAEFHCHRTTRQTGNGKPQVCAGWAGFLIKNPVFGGQMFRIIGRLGLLKHCVDAPWLDDIYNDLLEAEEAMTDNQPRRARGRG